MVSFRIVHIVVLLFILNVVYSSPDDATVLKVNTNRNPDLCKPLVIAHRGASGYVPEHTLGAYALAITMGADYVEPDLVMTKDGFLIARHENELSLTTDVDYRSEFANRFKNQTIDGRPVSGWFSEDFTLAELKTLRVKELMSNVRPGNTRMDGAFEIATFQEIIDLVKAMEKSERRIIGICPEIKHGLHFQRLGLSMEKPVVDLFHNNSYFEQDAPVYIQSFEVSNLKELKKLTDLKLLQLFSSSLRQPFDQAELGTTLTYDQMATAEGLKEVATYASAVGPDKSYIIARDANNNLGKVTTFVANAHAAGLLVHPFTFRAENTFLPLEFQNNSSNIDFGNMRGELEVYLSSGIDGFFTDQPDIAVQMRGICYGNVIPDTDAAIRIGPVLFLLITVNTLISSLQNLLF